MRLSVLSLKGVVAYNLRIKKWRWGIQYVLDDDLTTIWRWFCLGPVAVNLGKNPNPYL